MVRPLAELEEEDDEDESGGDNEHRQQTSQQWVQRGSGAEAAPTGIWRKTQKLEVEGRKIQLGGLSNSNSNCPAPHLHLQHSAQTGPPGVSAPLDLHLLLGPHGVPLLPAVQQ